MVLFPTLALVAPYLAPLGIATSSLVTIVGLLSDESPAARAARTIAAAAAVRAAFSALEAAAAFTV